MALKSIREAATTLGVSVHTVRRLAAAGCLRTVTVGRRRLVSEGEIDRIVATGIPTYPRSGTIRKKAKRSVG
jgi:excisionase family DNA binding protein